MSSNLDSCSMKSKRPLLVESGGVFVWLELDASFSTSRRMVRCCSAKALPVVGEFGMINELCPLIHALAITSEQ